MTSTLPLVGLLGIVLVLMWNGFTFPAYVIKNCTANFRGSPPKNDPLPDLDNIRIEIARPAMPWSELKKVG